MGELPRYAHTFERLNSCAVSVLESVCYKPRITIILAEEIVCTSRCLCPRSMKPQMSPQALTASVPQLALLLQSVAVHGRVMSQKRSPNTKTILASNPTYKSVVFDIPADSLMNHHVSINVVCAIKVPRTFFIDTFL